MVISIIGVLVGLLLPAIQSAREAGRRTQCQNNMRNIALGILGYANVYGKFPPAGVISDDPNKQNPGKPPIDVPRNQGIVSWHDPVCTPDSLEVPMYNWVVEILPYIDQQDLANAWARTGPDSGGGIVPVLVPEHDDRAGRASRATTRSARRALAVLRCPDDTTAQPGQGNLSYVVNGGFSLWTALPIGWTPRRSTASRRPTRTMTPGCAGPRRRRAGGERQRLQEAGRDVPRGLRPLRAVARARCHGTCGRRSPAITDGTTNTILLSENTLAGAGSPSIYSKNTETNWATPLATFCMFFGPPSVCGTAGQCIGGMLQPQAGNVDGPGWALANHVGTYANINFGQNLTIEGSFPFSNSGHSGGCNMAFCDGGVRFISATIDGTVYSKIITPAGSKLPIYARQYPVSQDAFVQ